MGRICFHHLPHYDDPIAEGDETFDVVLANPTGGAVIGKNAVARVTIVDNDALGRPGHGLDGKAQSLSAMKDGRVMVAGDFTKVNGSPRASLARVHGDLTTDETFDARLQPGAGIRRIAVQSDGKAIVIGSFTNLQSVPRTNIARFELDGTLDQRFAPSFSLLAPNWPTYGPEIQTIVVQPDDKIVVGGRFTSVDGITRVSIARLNPDGSVDPTFRHGIFINKPTWEGGQISDMLIQPDGKIVIAGAANTLRDPFRNAVVRLESNGSSDTQFTSVLIGHDFWSGSEIPVYVESLALQENGQIIAYGPSAPVTRLNRDGSTDRGFNFQLPPNASSFAGTGKLTIWTGTRDGTIWAGSVGVLGHLNPDGNLGAELNKFTIGMEQRHLFVEYDSSGYGHVRTISQESPAVTSFAQKSDGRVLIGGDFVSYGGLPAYGLAEVYPDGTPYGLLRLTAPEVVEGGRVRLNLLVPVNDAFTLERTADLNEWQVLLAMTATTNLVELLDPDPLGDTPRFYRLRRGKP